MSQVDIQPQRVEKLDTLQRRQQPRTAAAAACRRPTGPKDRLLGRRLSADGDDLYFFDSLPQTIIIVRDNLVRPTGFEPAAFRVGEV